uniref:Neprosin PEP catalytic domain-containing protein n=1 Tax=Oryza nivara TaxID=4536 RepID=A0A0E0IXT0_ORYNI
MRSLLAFFAASILLASTTTTVHGVHIDPNDIIKTIEFKPSVDRPKIVEKMVVLGGNNSFKFAEQAWHRSAAYGVNGPYHGASAWLPIWKVRVGPSEFSKSYLAIASPTVREFTPIPGKDPPNIDNQIALGITVYPQFFGDDLPRLYIYSTNDGGVKLKCFNLECSFVQTSKKHAIEWMMQDDGPVVWWVSLMDEPIGYFHESAFAAPFIESFHNEMGGHVLDRRPGGRHTLTPMGSGMYPSDGLQNAACIHAYLAIAYTGADQVDDPVNTIVTHPKCYDVKDDGPDLYRPGINVAFGGPEYVYN